MKYVLLAVLVIGGLFMFMQRGGANEVMSYEELKNKLDSKAHFVLVDVRTKEEFDAGHIPTAILLPYDEIDAKAMTVLPDKEKEIVVYCRSGRRSAIAKKALLALRYTNVADFGGINRWQGELVK